MARLFQCSKGILEACHLRACCKGKFIRGRQPRRCGLWDNPDFLTRHITDVATRATRNGKVRSRRVIDVRRLVLRWRKGKGGLNPSGNLLSAEKRGR